MIKIYKANNNKKINKPSKAKGFKKLKWKFLI